MEDINTKNEDRGAFACCAEQNYLQEGLTKREYFAAMAMQGLCAGRAGDEQPGASAKYAVELADHLLKALENEATTLE